eukprot:6226790-Pyramimonas_sp.AAC.1
MVSACKAYQGPAGRGRDLSQSLQGFRLRKNSQGSAMLAKAEQGSARPSKSVSSLAGLSKACQAQ